MDLSHHILFAVKKGKSPIYLKAESGLLGANLERRIRSLILMHCMVLSSLCDKNRIYPLYQILERRWGKNYPLLLFIQILLYVDAVLNTLTCVI